MRIQTYNDINISVLEKYTKSQQLMNLACDITQKKSDSLTNKKISSNLAKFIMAAKHDSIFEHSSITVLARGISRSLLAQITRQRTFKFTSASQHYQNYKNYPFSIRPGFDKNPVIKIAYQQALNLALEKYLELIELGELPEEARQVLPNACTVNLLITMDSRNLAKFLKVRLCKRNTYEMLIFANKLKQIAIEWIPEIFNNVHEPCVLGECNQGRMSCKGK